jgi:predicted nucleotidyltransferase component of viral defense system
LNFAEARRKLELLRRSSPGYQDMQRLMTRYGIECFLRRLCLSPHREVFILKGAMLFALYVPDGNRNTKDADFQIFGPNDMRSVRRLFTEVASIEVDDGVSFQPDGIRLKEAGKDRGYSGFEVFVPVLLDVRPTTLKFDVGFGEAISPEPLWKDFPSLISMSLPRIRVYPLESVVSEKFETIVKKGLGNTRLKDFYDLAIIASRIGFDSTPLEAAIKNTFERRKTPLPTSTPPALTERFFADKQRRKSWDGFLVRHSLPKALYLDECCQSIERFVMPVSLSLGNETPLNARWDGNAWV